MSDISASITRVWEESEPLDKWFLWQTEDVFLAFDWIKSKGFVLCFSLSQRMKVICLDLDWQLNKRQLQKTIKPKPTCGPCDCQHRRGTFRAVSLLNMSDALNACEMLIRSLESKISWSKCRKKVKSSSSYVHYAWMCFSSSVTFS